MKEVTDEKMVNKNIVTSCGTGFEFPDMLWSSETYLESCVVLFVQQETFLEV